MKSIDYSNFAVLGSIGSIVLLAGVAVLMKWISSQVAVRRQADSLTPADLKALETSAERMIEEIKETAVIACRDLDDRCDDLRKLILIADQKINLWAQLSAETQPAGSIINTNPTVIECPGQSEETDSAFHATQHPELVEGCGRRDSSSRVYQLADSGLPASDIARELEMPVGEVVLMLSLRVPTRVQDLPAPSASPAHAEFAEETEHPEPIDDESLVPSGPQTKPVRKVSRIQGLLG